MRDRGPVRMFKRGKGVPSLHAFRIRTGPLLHMSQRLITLLGGLESGEGEVVGTTQSQMLLVLLWRPPRSMMEE